MKKISISGDPDQLLQFAKIVILNGNQSDRYGKVELASMQKGVLTRDPTTMKVAPDYKNFRKTNLNLGNGIIVIANEDQTDLPEDFQNQKLMLIRPDYHKIIVVQNEGDDEAFLLARNDALLISEKTARSTSTGQDTLQIMAISAADIAGKLSRYNSSSYFKFDHNPKSYISRDKKKMGASLGAPYQEQIDSIKDWSSNDYKAQFEDIKNSMKREFSRTLQDNYKASILSGAGLASFDDVLAQAKTKVASGCEDMLADETGAYHEVFLLKILFNEEDSNFQDEIVAAQGQDYLDALVEDWSNRAVERALNPMDRQFAVNVMNPTALFNRHAQNKKEKLSAYTSLAAGSNPLLADALKQKMAPLLADHFSEQTQDYTSYNLPLIGQRNKHAGLQRFLKAVGV